MHLSKKKRVVAAILITLLISANTTISNEINENSENKTEIIDVEDYKTDNININTDRDELVMNDNISNNNENIQINTNSDGGTITNRAGMFTMISPNSNLTFNNKILPSPKVFKNNYSLPTKHKVNVTNKAAKESLIHPDLVINYAAIDSDMKIENIKTDGKVILTVDKNTEADKSVKCYNLFNISPSESTSQQAEISLTPQNIYDKSNQFEEDIKIINTGGASIAIEKIAPIPHTNIDKRQYLRFKTAEIKIPVNIETQNNSFKLIDISRGGVALSHSKSLKVNDIVPIRIKYKDVDITTNIKILAATDKRASGKFINEDKSISNRLLYLSVLLESDNKMLATRFSK